MAVNYPEIKIQSTRANRIVNTVEHHEIEIQNCNAVSAVHEQITKQQNLKQTLFFSERWKNIIVAAMDQASLY